jgi:hypothetical protein
MSVNVTDAMLNNGCKKKTFYCPSTQPRYTDNENFQYANSLWNFGLPAFNITGYTFAFGGPGSELEPVYQNRKILTELHTISATSNFVDSVASRELIADVMISNQRFVPASAADQFDNVFGGFMQNGRQYAHVSAHLRRGVPRGGNIAYKDGHAQWKKFLAASANPALNETKVRTGFNTPYFWW